MKIATHSVEETVALGRVIGRLATSLPQGICVALNGPLGAGKTQLARGIAQGAGVDNPDLVSSPTYVLLNVYEGRPAQNEVPAGRTVYHLDAYRIASLDDFGPEGGVALDELLEEGIVVVEWAVRVEALLPTDRLRVTIEHDDTQGGESGESGRRTIEIEGGGSSRELAGRVLHEWARRSASPGPSAIRIRGSLLDAMGRHAQEAYPEECCGILMGRPGADGVMEITDAIAAPNVAPADRGRRYQIDPRVILGAQRRTMASGGAKDVVGGYHSHPDHPAEFSRSDAAMGWEGYVYIVVPVSSNNVQTPRAWKLVEGEAWEVPIVREV